MSKMRTFLTRCITILLLIATEAKIDYEPDRNPKTFDLSASDQNSFYDPRSELSREMTSGEMTFKGQKDRVIGQSKHSIDDEIRDKASKNPKSPSQSNRIKKRDIVDEFYPLSRPHGINRTTTISRATFAQVQNSADNGSVEAAYFVGLFYLYGLSTIGSADASKAVEWFSKAGIAGNVDSQCALGLIYYHGIGSVGRDKKAALRWFYRASRSGHPRGHWLLGQALYEGMNYQDIGIKHPSQQEQARTKSGRNFNEIARLFSLAASTNIPDAIHQLGVLYEYDLIPPNFFLEMFVGTKEVNVTDSINYFDNYQMAIALYERAAKLGYAESIYNLGLMNAYGRGMPMNLLKAMDLFRAAAVTHSHVGSMRYLGLFVLNDVIHDKGKDYSHAIYWLEKCSNAEDNRFSEMCGKELNETRNMLEDVDIFHRKVFNDLNRKTQNENGN